jgi:hypothetical protein
VRVRVEPEAAIAIQVTTVTTGQRCDRWRAPVPRSLALGVDTRESDERVISFLTVPDLIIGAYRRSLGISRGSPYKIKSRLISPAMEMSKSVIWP